jgi:hypothetical protein
MNISRILVKVHTLVGLAKNLPYLPARSIWQAFGKTFIDVFRAYLSVLFGG